MGKTKRMDQVKLIIETYLTTHSLNATARRLQISKNTVRHYIRCAEAVEEDLSHLLSLSDEDLLPIFYSNQTQEINSREKIFSERVDYWLKELRRVGVTRHLLWEEYRGEYPD